MNAAIAGALVGSDPARPTAKTIYHHANASKHLLDSMIVLCALACSERSSQKIGID